ncbi:PTS sugar transporter subunit IIA [Alkalibacillus salilacus]|uniref:Fructose-specific phosphotransferase system IIA component n=1 Tax=Alkalibacillus salilacus TaxID=284582 RepID=A0ABT9VF06_9BACI|nr:fructose PTS transporter subunit IIA [Alkalibacillus salilacus]MDQ0159390.1 fructose-specific phosphotransferase system IIA component [Alkalibacillus salilacus]
MELKELLKKEHVLLDLDASSREESLDELIKVMQNTGVVEDAAVYKEAVLNREAEGSTGIGFGVAIPHGKSTGVSEPGLAFARLTNEVDWQSLDGNPVTSVFMIAIPEEQAGNEHLQILSQLSRKLMHEDFRQKLQDASSSDELLAALEA